MVKICLRITLPDELMLPFMQAIREFDTAHDPHHEGKVQVETLADTDFPADKLKAMFESLNPPFPYIGLKRFDS